MTTSPNLEQVETEIDGFTFSYQPMMLKRSRALFDKLVQRFGPAVASAIEGLKDAQLDEEMEMSAALGGIVESFGGLLRGFVEGLDPDFHAKLADELAQQTFIKNDSGNFVKLDGATREVIFGQRLLTESKLIAFCLSTQYADFLEPLRNLGTQAVGLRARAMSHFASPKASTGSRTESPPASITPTA